MMHRRLPSSSSGQLGGYDWRAAGWVAAGSVGAVVLLVFVVRDVLGWDFVLATRAPLLARNIDPRYGGWLGNLGVLGWTLATGITALGATVARRRGDRSAATYFAASSALSAVLLVDDSFLIHTAVAPGLFGVPKPAVILGIVVLGVAWVVAFSSRLLADPDLPMLVWSLGWYAMALLIDSFGGVFGWGEVREEMAKLIGVSSWLAFHWRGTLRIVAPADG